MQQDLGAAHPRLAIRLLGVDLQGLDDGNAGMVAGRTLPWLQDEPAVNVWGSWEVNWRDVVVLSPDNRRLAVYNLSVHDLSVPANYDSLKSLLLTAAR